MAVPLLLVALAGLISTAGNILLKISRAGVGPDTPLWQQYLTPWMFGALACYGLNVLLFAKALDRLPVSVGYPLLASVGFATLVVVSTFMLHERLTPLQWLGLACVLGGIVLLARDVLN